ncbi:hypothetical protein EST38_g14532 [Candolleomyces aberdarensis]|uniref:Uncharacterized protein n=1 Tax=Candolleomyces aberdarensis TaxID=2316362 RepID=A0A4Q2CX49_9AGAR|nr:hypothetical protein EST38_g14532 [Candolleomyces aberdarensis]
MIAKYQPPSCATQPIPIVLPPNQTTFTSLLRFHNNTWRESCTRAVQEEIQACEFAVASEKAARSQAIHDLPEMEEAQVNGIEAFLGAVSKEIAALFTVNIDSTVTITDPLVSLHLVKDAKALKVQTLVTEQLRHQTDETSKAVRKTANQSIALEMNFRTLQRFCEKGPTLCEELATRLKALSKASIPATSGVNRQNQNKATVRNSTAIAFLEERDKAFVHFRGPRLHGNFHITNISQFVPLAPGNLVIALSPTAKCRESISVNGNNFKLVNLCSISTGLFSMFCGNCDELYEALKVLQRSLNGQCIHGNSGKKDKDEEAN